MSHQFSYRIGLGEHHEKWVLSKLQELYGKRIKHAAPFGQGLLPEITRNFLRNSTDNSGAKNLLRWMPDIVCINLKDTCFLVEAKSGDRWKQTGNHAVEKESLQAAITFEEHFKIDVLFIFSDGRGLVARQLEKHPGKKEYSQRACAGSGTPFYTWPASDIPQIIEPTPPYLMEVTA